MLTYLWSVSADPKLFYTWRKKNTSQKYLFIPEAFQYNITHHTMVSQFYSLIFEAEGVNLRFDSDLQVCAISESLNCNAWNDKVPLVVRKFYRGALQLTIIISFSSTKYRKTSAGK